MTLDQLQTQLLALSPQEKAQVIQLLIPKFLTVKG
jgi:hypothetical protein